MRMMFVIGRPMVGNVILRGDGRWVVRKILAEHNLGASAGATVEAELIRPMDRKSFKLIKGGRYGEAKA